MPTRRKTSKTHTTSSKVDKLAPTKDISRDIQPNMMNRRRVEEKAPEPVSPIKPIEVEPNQMLSKVPSPEEMITVRTGRALQLTADAVADIIKDIQETLLTNPGQPLLTYDLSGTPVDIGAAIFQTLIQNGWRAELAQETITIELPQVPMIAEPHNPAYRSTVQPL